MTRKLPLKWYPTLGLYKASNVSFDPERELALSYDWWVFVKRIQGVLVFNNYRYSTTTSAHQRKVREVMDFHGIAYKLTEVEGTGLNTIETKLQLHIAEANTRASLARREEERRLRRNELARKARLLRRQVEAAHTMRNLLADVVVLHA